MTRPSLVLALALACLLAAGLTIAGSPLDLAFFAGSFAMFAAPGWPLARWFLGSRDRFARVPFAILLGYAVGLTIYLALRLTVGTPPLLVLVSCMLVAAALEWALPRDLPGVMRVASFTRADTIALAILLLAVAVIVGPVFANVGRSTSQGVAYRAYFIADLFAHMSVVAELSKNATPPVNPYLPSEALPYYWSFFTYPAIYDELHDALLGHVTVDRGILLTDLCMAAVYVSVWFVVLRSLGASTWAAAAGWLMLLFASSFEGTFYLWRQAHTGGSLWDFRYVNVDAITRWLWDLPPTDGLHRLFWYTPQHGMAVTLVFVVFGLAALARRPNSIQRGIIDGLLLGALFACSSFNGLLVIGAYAIFEVVLLAVDHFADLWSWLRARTVSAVVVLLFAAATVLLGMIQPSSGKLIVRLNPHFLRGPWAFVVLSFGPALLVAPFGLRQLAAWSLRALIAACAIVCVSVAAFLFIDIPGHENTYVTFRTAQLWYLMLAVLVAATVDAATVINRAARATLYAGIGLASAIAMPTVALDWYNARDISNTEMSPGRFPWTVYISPEAGRALTWIDTYLPETAIVQLDASVRGRASWALVPAFAERRLAVGWGLFEPNPHRFDEGIARARVLFRTPSVSLAYDLCQIMGIQYLYVGPEERTAHGPNADKFGADAVHFSRVYQDGGVTVYRVRPSKPDAGRDRVLAFSPGVRRVD